MHFPGGLQQALEEQTKNLSSVVESAFCGESGTKKEGVEWAFNWYRESDRILRSFCNTIPTVRGGTHEQGFRNALTRGLRAYGELIGNKSANLITTEDATTGLRGFLSVFTPNPDFLGQTKEKLTSQAAVRLVEQAVRSAFEQALADAPARAQQLLEHVIAAAHARQMRKKAQENSRKRRRLPGKLADCNQTTDTELFLVEGDSAGGSAKQARDRQFQAVLPLRGKILNVVSASAAKKQQNQQLLDIFYALGVQDGYQEALLRYSKVVIMTDADVDGAHIASLLITFFYQELPELIRHGHLFLAVPPLYRLSGGGNIVYARDDAHRDQLLKKFRHKVEISRFKGARRNAALPATGDHYESSVAHTPSSGDAAERRGHQRHGAQADGSQCRAALRVYTGKSSPRNELRRLKSVAEAHYPQMQPIQLLILQSVMVSVSRFQR